MENGEDLIGHVTKRRSVGDGVSRDAVAADGGGGDGGGVGGGDEGGVAAKLDKAAGADEDGAEFEQRVARARAGRDRGLNVEEGDLRWWWWWWWPVHCRGGFSTWFERWRHDDDDVFVWSCRD